MDISTVTYRHICLREKSGVDLSKSPYCSITLIYRNGPGSVKVNGRN